MEIEPKLSQVDFEVAISSFHDELLSKLQYFNTVQIELLRKFECNINLPQTHTELVFYLRNMIKMIEEAFKDVQSYFQDLRMAYLYDYFRKIQVLMVNGFNFLSQALIIQIDGNQKERECKTKTKEMDRIVVKQRVEPVKNLKDQAKEMEHYDYAINYYQKQQAKIAEEMHRMQDNIIMSKGLIDKLHPSKAVQQIQEIKQRAEITLENTEKIFEETYQLKYLEFKQYLSKLQKPEDIAKELCNNLKVTMFDKFETGMKKSVNMLYSIKKQDELLRLVNNSVQTDQLQMPKIQKKHTTASSKPGQKLQNLLLRQRKLTEKLLGELQLARKDIQTLQAQRQRFQIMFKQAEGKANQLSYNYDILSKIYDEKRQQIILLKRWIEEKDFLIHKLKPYQLMFFKGLDHVDQIVQTEGLTILADAEVQANMQENEIIVILKKTNQKMSEKIRQKEIKIKEIQKKQISEKKQKISRLSINQTVPPQKIANLSKFYEESRSLQSDKQLPSNKNISQDRQITSLMNSGDMLSKDYTKILLKPSNFAIKRFSNNGIITIDNSKLPQKHRQSLRSRQSCRKSSVRHPTEISLLAAMSKTTNGVKMTSQKQIQVDFIQHSIISQERRTEGARFDEDLKIYEKESEQKHPQYTAIESTSHPKQNKYFIKKNVSAAKNRNKWRKDASSQPNRQNFSFSNQLQTVEPAAQSMQHPQQKQKKGLFQNLNLETQQTKLALQKRSALSKNFLCNIKKRQGSMEVDEKNKTCIGQFYKPRKMDESLQTKHLICIDRIDLAKKQTKKYQKMSVNSKPSQKLIKTLQKQNSQKIFQGKMK